MRFSPAPDVIHLFFRIVLHPVPRHYHVLDVIVRKLPLIDVAAFLASHRDANFLDLRVFEAARWYEDSHNSSDDGSDACSIHPLQLDSCD